MLNLEAMMDEFQVKVVQSLLEHFGDRLKAIVAFGSMVTGQAKSESDLDLLLVATNLPAKWTERVPEIVTVQRKLRFRRYVDILLVTPEECRANFEGHNPLYLDIAFDGVVLFDQDLVAKLMEETRAYVAERGIIRKKTGWKFPVEYRKETPLSKVTNGGWAKVWIDAAIKDLEAAQLLKTGENYENAVYHCQQAVEKCIKAILICWGEFEKTHYVSEVLVECLGEQDLDAEWREKLGTVAQIGHDIEPEVSLTRYPGRMGDTYWIPAEEYDEAKAEDWIQKTEYVVKIARNFVDWWFEPKTGNSEGEE